MTAEEIKDAFLQAARAARDEHPIIGLDTVDEWTMRGRLAIQLARRKKFVDLESSCIHVDIEYGGVSAHESKKIPGLSRIDLIVHQRGSQLANHLAVELKIDDAKATKVDPHDRQKLIGLTKECQFSIGVWIRLPKTAKGHRGRYAVFRAGKPEELRDL